MLEIRLALAGALALIGAAWGSIDVMLQGLLVAMALDWLTGVGAGFVRRELSSKIGWAGLTRKAMTLGIVAAATAVEQLLDGIPTGRALAAFYLANEVLSILENAAVAGVPVPSVLKDALARLRDAGDRKTPAPTS